ncbi:MAG: erythromycin biosynthesis sensory transduction protein eryC1 [Polaromonas sp.]|nr:erythromycin biosynthesis sensory transduction protein eryC1 [Polaromonas sp.]
MQAANQGLDVQASVARVVARDRYLLGEETRAFEQAFGAYCGVAHCVTVANGTDALELALRALDVGPGDTVMLTANAGYYGSIALQLVGARACYVDIDPRTMTLDPQALAHALKRCKPKAVIVTHLYGQLADIETLCALAARDGVAVIEDCAQSHGAAQGGRRAGSFGRIGCFSFYPTKNLGALGDAGAVVCSDAALAKRLTALRQYGWGRKYHNDVAGGRNSRIDEFQAAVLNDKLGHLDACNAQRREAADRYHAAFAGLPLQAPAVSRQDYVAHLYVVRSAQRNKLQSFLATRGVQAEVHYPIPDHRQATAAGHLLEGESLPHTQAACDSVLSLPCYPGLPRPHQQAVVAAVLDFFRR